MERAIIIYGSQYGTTKRYAEHLSEMTGIEAVAFKDAKAIEKIQFPGERRFPLLLNAGQKAQIAAVF